MSHTSQKEQPQRTCLGCRQSVDKQTLLRFVLSPDGEVVPDLEDRLPGRGAYTCLNAECLAAAVKQRAFNRSFKGEVKVLPAPELTALVDRLIRNRILGYLGLANRAGKIISGGALVSDALRSGSKPGLVLIGADVSENIGEKIASLAELHGVPNRCLLSKDDFGAILGKAPRSAVAIKASGFVRQILNEINRYRNFLGEV